MSAPLTVVLPDAKAVKDMLSGLVGKPVGVLPGAPVTPSENGTNVRCSCDLRKYGDTDI